MADGAEVGENSLRRNAVIGTLVAGYAIFDALTFLVVIVTLAALFNPLWVFIGAVVVISVINLASCRWLDGEWDGWVAAGHAHRIEAKLARWRQSSLMKHPVQWVTGKSNVLFALGAMLINPVIVVAIARLVGGQTVGEQRIRVASISYAIFFSGIFALFGLAINDGTS